MSELKQVILVNMELGMSRGKIAAQVAHAAVEASLLSINRKEFSDWRKRGMKKIVLKCPDLKTLLQVHREAKREKLITYLVTDAGRTEIPSGSKTALAIGPDTPIKIDKVTKDFKFL
jgi:PTH2 family peptidyl-tRNA hydrolase